MYICFNLCSTLFLPPPLDYSGFNSPYSVSDLELHLPSDRDVTKLAWIGVCSNTNEVIARITVLPGCMLRLPCKASYLGELPNAGGEGISGRVYLVNRVTFAILCFNYENNNQNGNYIRKYA